MSAWTDEVTKYYKEKKATNPNYKFMNALKDLSAERKNGKKGGDAVAVPSKSEKKKRSKKSKTLKKRR